MKLHTSLLTLAIVTGTPILNSVSTPIAQAGDYRMPTMQPTVFPQLDQAPRSLFNPSMENGSYTYEYYYANAPASCTATACWYGSFSSKAGNQVNVPAKRDLGPRGAIKQVTLANGIQGTFVNSSGAYDIGSVSWVQGGRVYSAIIKNGKKAQVVEMANSAIRAGLR
jgi:hypothetical protein